MDHEASPITTTDMVAVIGEVSINFSCKVSMFVRNTIRDVGSDNAEEDFDYHMEKYKIRGVLPEICGNLREIERMDRYKIILMETKYSDKYC